MNNTKISTSTMTTVTIVFLILFFPIGLLLMWFKTQWPKPAKLIVSAVFALILSGDAYAFSHASALPVSTPIITKAPVTLTPTNSPTPSPSYTPTPIPTRIYIRPTATPATIIFTPTTTASDTTSQQSAQTANGATALCVDGTYSYADHHQGACSHHQGVQVFYK